jgi:hypothetical protein
MQAWSVLGAGVQVLVRRGRLLLRTLSPIPVLYRGVVLHPDDPDDPYIFRIDLSRYGMAPARIVFSRDPATATIGVHLDGLQLSAAQRPASPNGRVWATRALGVVAVATAATALHRRRARPDDGRYREDHCPDAAAALEDRLGVITPIDPP